MFVAALTATQLLERAATAVNNIKAKGKEAENTVLLNSRKHVSTLDDTETKRNSLVGVLFVTHGQLLAVSHDRHFHQSRLRTHAGGLAHGCTLNSTEDLAKHIKSEYLGLLAPSEGVVQHLV